MSAKFFAVVFIQLKILFVFSNPLIYFELQSLANLNLDILFVTHESPRQLELTSFQAPVAVHMIHEQVSWDQTTDNSNHQFLTRFIIFDPRNESEMLWILHQIMFDHEVSDYFVIIWPYQMKNESAIIEEISSIPFNFRLDSNIFLLFALEESNSNGESTVNVSIWEIYSIKETQFINKIIHTEISEFQMVQFWKIGPKVARRNNFQQIKIVAVAAGSLTYASEAKFSNKSGTLELESGFAVSIFRDMKKMLNFSESSRTGYWLALENGTVQGGQAFELQEELADISISQNVARTELINFVTFLQPTYSLSVLAFFKEPPLGSTKDIYAGSFQAPVWALYFLVFLLTPWIIKLFLKLLSVWRVECKRDDNLNEEFLVWSIGAFCQQGWYILPKANSLRILFLTSYLAAAIGYNSYSASLISTFSLKTRPIQSFKDLLNFKYPLIIDSQSDSIGQLSKTLVQQYDMKDPAPVATLSIMDKILSENSALIYYADSIQYVFYPLYEDKQSADKVICKAISNVAVNTVVKPSGISVKKNSPYRETFNLKIIQLKERGFNRRYALVYRRATEPKCLLGSNVRYDPLLLMDVLTAHTIFAVGVGVSFVSMVIERLVAKKKVSVPPYHEWKLE